MMNCVAVTGALEEWEEIVDTNVKGLLYCTRAILPKMVYFCHLVPSHVNLNTIEVMPV